jgi:hypothetical protein
MGVYCKDCGRDIYECMANRIVYGTHEGKEKQDKEEKEDGKSD